MAQYEEPIDSPQNGTNNIPFLTSTHQIEQPQKEDLTTITTATSDSAISIASLISLLNGLLPTDATNPAIGTKTLEDDNANTLRSAENNYYATELSKSAEASYYEENDDHVKYKQHENYTSKSSITNITIGSPSPSNPNPSLADSIHNMQDEDTAMDSAVSFTSLNSLLDGLDGKGEDKVRQQFRLPDSAIKNSSRLRKSLSPPLMWMNRKCLAQLQVLSSTEIYY